MLLNHWTHLTWTRKIYILTHIYTSWISNSRFIYTVVTRCLLGHIKIERLSCSLFSFLRFPFWLHKEGNCLCFVTSAVFLPLCVGVVNQPVSTLSYTPAPDLLAITYLRPSPVSSPVCSTKVPALPVFSPRLLLDLTQAVQQTNTLKTTCDSPAPSKNVQSSVSLSSNMNLHKSADSVSFWSTCVCVLKNKCVCLAHVCMPPLLHVQVLHDLSGGFLDPSLELTAALLCVVTALINLIMMTYRWGFMLR